MFSKQNWSIERVVTLLTPLFATAATWLCTLVATNVPGAPKLDPSAVEGIEIAAFLGTVGIAGKWLHGRQKPELLQLERAAAPPVRAVQAPGDRAQTSA